MGILFFEHISFNGTITRMFDADDRKHMRAALALAEKNIGMACPNPSVGCVVVHDGRIAGEGWHEYDSMDHAEVRALQMAGDKALGSTLYVTLEPCCHHGRTPPCADLLLRKGIRRVVVARVDPNPRVSGGGIARLRAGGIRVDVGLMEEEAGRVIEPFACSVGMGRPLVTCKVGMTLDGKIGSGRRGGRTISSHEGREFGQFLRLRSDALLVGAGTVLSDDPELTYRGALRRRRRLIKVVLDSRLRTPPDARIFRDIEGGQVLIFCADRHSRQRRRKLEKSGAEVIPVPKSRNVLDLEAVIPVLSARDVQAILVEGGSHVHWEFISAGAVDRFVFIIAPMVLGGEHAIPSVGGKGFAATKDAPRFRIGRKFFAGPDLVVEAYPSYSRSIISPWRLPEIPASSPRYRARTSGKK
jgi:diaminohydroxyphosphoribosylaminopyrimidine deaminase/5-amino-6-(5-phosphoribosylamino)uracil reductase